MRKNNFFKEIKKECKQIVWPKKDEVIRKTSLVIVVSFVLTLLIFSFFSINDLALHELLVNFM